MNAEDLEISIPEDSIEKWNRFRETIEAIDAVNSEDPNSWTHSGYEYPREWIFGIYHYNEVLKLKADAGEFLLIAARGQHIARWMSSRKDYPEGRAGYLKWRADLKDFHAEKCAQILIEKGYTSAEVEIVRNLNLKKGIKSDPDCQILEDALCLVFLQHQFEDIANKYEDEKVIGILQKTAKKMSPHGLGFAGKIEYSEKCRQLLQAALQV